MVRPERKFLLRKMYARGSENLRSDSEAYIQPTKTSTLSAMMVYSTKLAGRCENSLWSDSAMSEPSDDIAVDERG